MAFSVEYINAHPFLAEYDKAIVFKSGKRIGVCMDTGGAGPFAVYRLPTGEYYLADGLKHNFIRNDYRVNVTNETVEMMTGDAFWIRIPDDTLAVVGVLGFVSFKVGLLAGEAHKVIEKQLAFKAGFEAGKSCKIGALGVPLGTKCEVFGWLDRPSPPLKKRDDADNVFYLKVRSVNGQECMATLTERRNP